MNSPFPMALIQCNGGGFQVGHVHERPVERTHVQNGSHQQHRTHCGPPPQDLLAYLSRRWKVHEMLLTPVSHVRHDTHTTPLPAAMER